MTKGKVNVQIANYARTERLGMPYVQLVIDDPRAGLRRLNFCEQASVIEQLTPGGEWRVVRSGLGPKEREA